MKNINYLLSVANRNAPLRTLSFSSDEPLEETDQASLKLLFGHTMTFTLGDFLYVSPVDELQIIGLNNTKDNVIQISLGNKKIESLANTFSKTNAIIVDSEDHIIGIDVSAIRNMQKNDILSKEASIAFCDAFDMLGLSMVDIIFDSNIYVIELFCKK